MAVQKQLFELLEEQQEPFDIKRLRTRKGFAVGFLKCLLAKIVRRKGFAKCAVGADGKSSESGRPSVFSCFSETGALTPDVFSEHEWRCAESEGSKQLSPVSVLQFLNHRFKEDNSSTTSSFDSPREAPDACAFAHNCADDSKKALRLEKQLMENCVKEAEERVGDQSNGRLRAEEAEMAINGMIIAWQSLRGDVSSLNKLIGSDMLEISKDWSNFGPGVTNVGMEIESAIFGDIVDEIVLDLLVHL